MGSIPLASLRVLLVREDEAEALRLREALAAEGVASVARASNLRAVGELLRTGGYDVALVDTSLPGASSATVVETVRELAPRLPILVVSALDDRVLAGGGVDGGGEDRLPLDEALRSGVLRRAMGWVLGRARIDVLERRLAATVEASSDAMVGMDTEGRITSWNRAAVAIFGMERAAAVGSKVSDAIRLADTEVGADLVAHDTVTSAPGARFYRFLRRDGVRLTISVVIVPVDGGDGSGTVSVAICRDVTASRAHMEETHRRNEELVARDRQMRALTARLHAVREEERTRLSRVVHDELGQLLTGLKMDLGWVRKRIPADIASSGVLQERLLEAEGVADSTLQTVQRIALELRPTVLDALGLAAALRDEARRFERRAGLTVVLSVEEPARAVPPTIATAFFRVLQELLANVARHARAAVVDVAFGDEDGAWTLRVADDGVGMDTTALTDARSLGLLGMRERVEALRGAFRVRPRVPRGTSVEVRIPTGGAA